jgi:hypothetical protein
MQGNAGQGNNHQLEGTVRNKQNHTSFLNATLRPLLSGVVDLELSSKSNFGQRSSPYKADRGLSRSRLAD